ncbi:hypothetical protein [Natronorubrum halalkaliphilum]|nr:hypothetical protein [Natronorubrum halalkaliphilum]
MVGRLIALFVLVLLGIFLAVGPTIADVTAAEACRLFGAGNC